MQKICFVNVNGKLFFVLRIWKVVILVKDSGNICLNLFHLYQHDSDLLQPHQDSEWEKYRKQTNPVSISQAHPATLMF